MPIRRQKLFVGKKDSSAKNFVGKNFGHLTKISSLFADGVFTDKVCGIRNAFQFN